MTLRQGVVPPSLFFLKMKEEEMNNTQAEKIRLLFDGVAASAAASVTGEGVKKRLQIGSALYRLHDRLLDWYGLTLIHHQK